MLDLNEVAMFVQVVRSGSFAEAARRLNMPSPTVSRRIQQLEARLGTRLMQRSTRKLELTSAGRAFYERCGPAVKELIEAGQLQMADSTAPSGPVRVAVPTLFFDFFDMAWVAAFLEAHPLVTLDFVPSDLQLDLIADRIDVAFCSGPLQDSSYAARKICASDAELIASPAYLTAQGMPVSPEDLSEHACVVQSDASGSTWRLRDMAGVETDVRVQGRFKSNAHQALRKAACTGLGIAALPSILTAADVAAGRLVRVLPGYTRVGPGLNVVYPSRGRRPLAVSMFVEMVVERLSLKDHAATSRAIA